tara:strand:+ start:23 stop:202 length:180 start_codon:yes stop_codon:yes gene_type:complete
MRASDKLAANSLRNFYVSVNRQISRKTRVIQADLKVLGRGYLYDIPVSCVTNDQEITFL